MSHPEMQSPTPSAGGRQQTNLGLHSIWVIQVRGEFCLSYLLPT